MLCVWLIRYWTVARLYSTYFRRPCLVAPEIVLIIHYCMHPRIIWQLVLWWSNKHEYSEHLISRLFWSTSQIETTKSLYRMLSPQPDFPLLSLFLSLLSSHAFKVTLFTDRSKQVSIGPAPLSTLTWPWPRRTSIRLVWRKFCLRELIDTSRDYRKHNLRGLKGR